ncbi:hypothetical protein [Acinetobacter sp. NyZ410]|uniref:hypothetical protein n=1 Tax=Acinetobacter sp. NyZ410 TaxID=2929509 RepID=UPI001FB8F098|nr:hypothetical protein [Acinetobacter sp. NyZ410]UOH20452.1 hypothetical protein MTO68_09980 [Acinetobacter sp. NyZ410]
MKVIPELQNHKLDNNTKIWRYMDFTKFLDLIINQRLYFRRIDLFEDPYEGYIRDAYKAGVEKDYLEIKTDLNLRDDEHKSLVSSHFNGLELIPLNSYASCWYLGVSESAAMWKLYGATSDCIAICSTVNDLAVTLDENNEEVETGCLYLQKVDYINHSSQPSPKNWLKPMFEKRESFAHENEFRALFVLNDGLKCLSWPNHKIPSKENLKRINEDGFCLDINVIQLVKKIYISPTASPLFHDLVEKVLKLVDLDGIECVKSDLYKLK